MTLLDVFRVLSLHAGQVLGSHRTGSRCDMRILSQIDVSQAFTPGKDNDYFSKVNYPALASKLVLFKNSQHYRFESVS